MQWSIGYASGLLLRAGGWVQVSRRTEEFWKQRLNAHAALNDPLPSAPWKNHVLRPIAGTRKKVFVSELF